MPMAAAPNLLGNSALNARGNGVVRTATLQRMQKTVGNRAVQRLAGQHTTPVAVQRDPPPAATPAPAAATPTTASPTAAAGTTVWHSPFALGDVSDRPHAILVLLQMQQKVADLQDMLSADQASDLDSDKNAIHTLLQRLNGEGPLTPDDLGALSFGTGMIEARYNAKLTAVANAISAALNRFLTPVDTSVEEAQLAEELHVAFIEGSVDRIGKAKGALDKLKDYNGKVGKVAEWAGRIAGAVGAARTVEAIKRVTEVSGGIATGIGHIQNVLTVASSFATLAGFDNQAGGQAQNSINQFRAGLAAIDVAMGFASAVPLLGTLWTSYYRPLTDACLRGVAAIARATDREARNLTLLQWMQEPRPAGATPTIPQGLTQFFPGGQEILNFMYPLVNGGGARVTPGVERFFLARRQLFNAGQGSDELHAQSNWHWYNPMSWGADDTAPDLMPWVERNADTVWSQLYGSLPHALR
jgi:hypothetical protein